MEREIMHKSNLDTSPIIIYTTEDDNISLDVKLENETVWLSQTQMATLFGRDRTVIARHINNCFKEGELDRNITCAKFAHMGIDGDQVYDSDILTAWLSVDPMADKYPSLSLYNYCNWNPIKLVDQDGEVPVKALVTTAKLVKKAYNIYKKTGNLTMKSLKKAGLDELIGIADDINTIFSGDASLTDRMAAAVDLLAGTELNNKGVKKSLSIAGVKKGPPSN